MPPRIAVINRKGGSGKSASVFQLSGSLAHGGLKVLIIDADPQGSVSKGFFGKTQVRAMSKGETLTALFDDSSMLSSPISLVVSTPFPRISIVRSNKTLDDYNETRPTTRGMQQHALTAFLDEIELSTMFDIVLIDCPPNLNLCSWNALLAADFLIIPVPPEDFGTQEIDDVHEAIDKARVISPRLTLLGHLISRIDRRLLIHRHYAHVLRETYPDDVFAAEFPERTEFKSSISARTPATHLNPRSPEAAILTTITNEMFERIGRSLKPPKVV